MFYCKDVYPDLLDGQICVGVCDGTLRPEFWEDAPAPYRRLAERCWHHDPKCAAGRGGRALQCACRMQRRGSTACAGRDGGTELCGCPKPASLV